MKTTTIFTIVAIVGTLGIMAASAIGIGIQQASASACNIFADENGFNKKQTGNSCNQLPGEAPGTNNIHFHFPK